MPLRRGRLPAIPSSRAAPGSRAQRGSGMLSFRPGWLGGDAITGVPSRTLRATYASQIIRTIFASKLVFSRENQLWYGYGAWGEAYSS